MKMLSLWLPDSQYQELSTLCLIKEQSLSLIMRLAVEAYLQEHRASMVKDLQSLKKTTSKAGVVIRPQEEDIMEADNTPICEKEIGIVIN